MYTRIYIRTKTSGRVCVHVHTYVLFLRLNIIECFMHICTYVHVHIYVHRCQGLLIPPSGLHSTPQGAEQVYLYMYIHKYRLNFEGIRKALKKYDKVMKHLKPELQTKFFDSLKEEYSFFKFRDELKPLLEKCKKTLLVFVLFPFILNSFFRGDAVFHIPRRADGEVRGWGRDPKKCTGRDWGMGSSTI